MIDRYLRTLRTTKLILVIESPNKDVRLELPFVRPVSFSSQTAWRPVRLHYPTPERHVQQQIIIVGLDAADNLQSVHFAINPVALALLDCDLNETMILVIKNF